MLVKKITDGFVIQTYDTDKGKWLDQEFVAGDYCELEDENGNCLENDALVRPDGKEVYLPFFMVQPSANGFLPGQQWQTLTQSAR